MSIVDRYVKRTVVVDVHLVVVHLVVVHLVVTVVLLVGVVVDAAVAVVVLVVLGNASEKFPDSFCLMSC